MRATSASPSRCHRPSQISSHEAAEADRAEVEVEDTLFSTPLGCQAGRSTCLDDLLGTAPANYTRLATDSTSGSNNNFSSGGTSCDDDVGLTTLSSTAASSKPYMTNLDHFHSEAHLKSSAVVGRFIKVRKLSNCCRDRGEVQLCKWAKGPGYTAESVAVKRVPLTVLWENRGKEKEERAVHRYECNREMEDNLTEIGIYSYLQRQETSSPFILRMHAAFERGADAWLVLQHADGGDLFHAIKGRNVPVTAQQALQWTGQLLQAVDFLHKNGIGHRDISIENLLLRDGDIRLMDFGQAVQSHSDSGHLLRYFCALGKPYYRAPERYVPVENAVRVIVPAKSLPGDVVFVHTSTPNEEFLCDVLLPSTAVGGRECLAEPWGYTAPPADVFSCGVCFFIMATGGIPPWQQAKPLDPHFSFVQHYGIIAMLRSYKKSMRPVTEELLDAMLFTNPMERVTVVECLAHSVWDPGPPE